MSKIQKLVQSAMANPNGLSFSAFQAVMRHHGWNLDRQKGSHQIWISPSGKMLPVQDWKGKAKAYQVRQFWRMQEDE